MGEHLDLVAQVVEDQQGVHEHPEALGHGVVPLLGHRQPLEVAARELEADQAGSLYLLRAGTGATRVLFWSQMHGDEPTATRALTDLFHYIANAPDDPRVQRWRDRLSLYAIPMLNPDAAEVPQRRNAFGVDVNRDARSLRTPEGRALKAATGAGLFGAAGFAGYMVLMFLSMALMWALGSVMHLGWAALIVAVVWAIVAAILAVTGKKYFDRMKGLRQTQETVQEIPPTLNPNKETP